RSAEAFDGAALALAEAAGSGDVDRWSALVAVHDAGGFVRVHGAGYADVGNPIGIEVDVGVGFSRCEIDVDRREVFLLLVFGLLGIDVVGASNLGRRICLAGLGNVEVSGEGNAQEDM